MVCNIAINSVVLDPTTGNVIVQGFLNIFTACGGQPVVTVSVTCGGQTYNVTATLQQNPQQPTFYTFTAIVQTNCSCNSPVSVVVTNNCPNYTCTTNFSGILCCCPTLSNLTSQVGNCDANGNRPVTLNATITIPQQSCLPVQVQWDFGDGNLGPIITYNSSGTFSLSINHTYSPGNYNAQLLILTPIGCPIQSISITVPPCPTTCCPVISTNVSIGDCNSNGDFVATFTTTITVNQGCPSAVVQWNYGDGNNGTAQSFGQGTSTFTDTHTYNVNSSPPPPYTATLNVISPSGCPNSSVIINTPNTNACNCNTSFLSWLCPHLFGVMTFGLGLALICILLATCPGLSSIANGLFTAAAVFAVLAVVALVFYLIFCRNCVTCGWLFLLLWRIFFGARDNICNFCCLLRRINSLSYWIRSNDYRNTLFNFMG